MSNKEEPLKATPIEEPPKPKGHIRRFGFIYTHLILILAVVGIFIWKTTSENSLNELHKKEQETTRSTAKEFVADQHEKYLRMEMQSLVWAVSGAMTEGKTEKVREYFRGLVKSSSNVSTCALVDTKGNFVITTDQKLEGEKYDGPYSEVFVNSTEIICEYESDRGEYLVSAPLLGENGKLGYLFFLYAPDQLSF